MYIWILGMGCGGDIVGINGSIISLNYFSNYIEWYSCCWFIIVFVCWVIIVYVVNINILGSLDCNCVYVEIYNGYLDLLFLFGWYCGNVCWY